MTGATRYVPVPSPNAHRPEISEFAITNNGYEEPAIAHDSNLAHRMPSLACVCHTRSESRLDQSHSRLLNLGFLYFVTTSVARHRFVWVSQCESRSSARTTFEFLIPVGVQDDVVVSILEFAKFYDAEYPVSRKYS
jgi:hypothetical protein